MNDRRSAAANPWLASPVSRLASSPPAMPRLLLVLLCVGLQLLPGRPASAAAPADTSTQPRLTLERIFSGADLDTQSTAGLGDRKSTRLNSSH